MQKLERARKIATPLRATASSHRIFGFTMAEPQAAVVVASAVPMTATAVPMTAAAVPTYATAVPMTATAMPVTTTTAVPMAAAVPLSGVQLDVPTAAAVPVQQAPVRAQFRRQQSLQQVYREHLSLNNKEHRGRNVCFHILFVLGCIFSAFCLVRTAQGCGCPDGYSYNTGSDSSGCHCSGDMFTGRWDCGHEVRYFVPVA